MIEDILMTKLNREDIIDYLMIWFLIVGTLGLTVVLIYFIYQLWVIL